MRNIATMLEFNRIFYLRRVLGLLVLSSNIQLGQCDCSGIDEPNSTRNPTTSSFLTGDVVNYACATGYTFSSGSVSRTCQADTSWSGSPLVCEIKTCSSPTIVQQSSRSPDQTVYNFTTPLTYTCNTGYSHTSGNLTRLCQADTTWSGDEPVCTIKTCSSPSAVADSSRSPDQTVYNFTTPLTYTCNTGYSHTSGNLTRVCQAGTTWSGDEHVCTVNTCSSLPAVANASISPDQPSYNYTSSITYTCNTGYSHTSGNLTRVCQADTTWSGDEPFCTIKTCSSPSAVPDSSRSPDQTVYNFTTTLTYTCNTGYSHTSGNLTRVCQAGTTWSGDEPVCTINACSSPPAVANASMSPDQPSYNYTSSITYTCNTGYSHTSGNLTRVCQADTTWSGNEPVCTIKTCSSPSAVPDSSRSPEQTVYNFTTTLTYTCNTGYSHTSGNLTRVCQADTTWSGDEPVCTINACSSPPAVANASISPDQPSYNYTSSITYTCNTGYSHTSGNLTRVCQADTTWSGDEPFCTIKACSSPSAVPDSSRSPDQAVYNFTTTLTYTCNTGYSHTSGNLTRVCQADTTWSGDEPACTINACSIPPAVANASISPDQPSYNYTSSITYTCNTGYSHTSGNLTRVCQADTTWSEDEPVCTIKSCSSPSAVPDSSRSPDQTVYYFTTTMTYTCNTGYSHTSGTLTRVCQAGTTWSGDEPVCTINACSSPPAVANASISPDQPSYNYTSSITYTCNTGYSHTSGNLTRICQADTTWSGDEPFCTIKTCSSPSAVADSSRSPDQTVYNFTTTMTYTCNTGYSHTSGNLTRLCQADTTWSGDEPVCTINACSSPLAVANASISPDQPSYNYTSTITYMCNTGYSQTSGNLTRVCQADITWSGDEPVCTINACSSLPAVANSSISPDQPSYNYTTSITYTCNTGYSHTSGNLTRICQADTTWSGDEPFCTIKTCSSPSAVAESSRSPEQTVYNFTTTLTYTCNTGYSHTSGNLTRLCQADTTWSGDEPVCTINACSSPPAVANASISPDQPSYNYTSSITYSCNTGYSHTSGNLTRVCQADTTWSGDEPVCTINACSSLPAVANASISPDQPSYNYTSSITYTCNTGYSHTSGNLTRVCQADTTWSGDEPVCTINTCSSLPAVAYASMSPDQPSYNYTSSITYTCNTGYSHTSGNLTRVCQADTTWSGDEPVCTIKECASPAAVPNSSKFPDEATSVYATLLTYTCDVGYTHTSGDLNRTCQANTAWSGAAPVCTINTCVPDSVPNSSKVPNSAQINYGASITYTCDLVYDHTDGDLTRHCQANSTWNGTTPVCTLVGCSPTVVLTHGTTLPLQARYLFGENVTVTCNLGYYVDSGDDHRTCLTSGSWSGTRPYCNPIPCSDPATVSDSSKTPAGPYYYGTTITYSCDLSFNHTTGDLTRTCQNFTWSGTAPVCTVAACIKDPATYMTLTPDTVLHNFGDQVTYECIQGYNHSSGDLQRTCQNDGSWTATLPACVIVKCILPSFPDHTAIAPTDALIEYNNTITYTCDLGYNRTDGDQYRTCMETGLWSGSEAVCTIVTCLPPPNKPFATYHPVQAIYNYSTVVTYQCDYGYYLSSGSLDTQCTELANWTTIDLICSIVECTALTEPNSSYLPAQLTFEFNTTITYTCNTGHNLTSGNDVRTCTNDTTWDGLPPECDPVICAFPESVAFSTSAPTQVSYVYQDWINYTCVTGYEMTSGNSSRECDEHAEWTGVLPNCTIKVCVPPVVVANATFTPVLPEHNWNTSVTFTCDTGYEYNTGVATRTCLDDKTWSGDPYTCKIKKCPRIDVQYMTLSPADVGGEYDYLTVIDYACVVGYNHSYGDLQRTCLDTKDWSGFLPNCTIVTCDPPADIAHTNYEPVQVEYIWQDEIHYACDPLYHYVTGVNFTACNESGIFPPVDFDCSVMHTLTKNAAEPTYAWINETSTSANIVFDFDGMCDVTLSATPTSLGVAHSISGTSLTVTVTEMSSVYGTYVVTLYPFRLWRFFDNVTTDVYYGREITGLQGRVNNPITTLMVDAAYEFQVNTTDGTTVQLDWDFEGVGSITQYYGTGVFSYAAQNYTFNSPGEFNVTVTATNVISSQTVIIPVIAIYGPNNIAFIASTNTPNTTQTIDIQLKIKSTAFLPMHDVNITVYLGDDTANVTDSKYIGPDLSLPKFYTYSHLYPVQGDYYAELRVQSWVGFREYTQTIQVWDPLDNLDLGYVGGNGIYITNDTVELDFVLHPEAGFLYSLDYDDGSAVISVTDTDIYKHPYNVSSFTHAYGIPGVYNLRWTALNGLYSRDETKIIIVQNPVANHSYTLDPVGKKYPWSVLQVTDIPLNITLNDTVAIPTNVTCDFDAGDGSSIVYGLQFEGQFFQHLHRFLVEGVFQPVFNCSNLVSNYDYIFNITVLKYQPNFTTVVFEPLVPLNISDSVTVYFHIDNDGFAWLPYNVILTFDFGNGVDTYPYDKTTYTREYSERGDYDVIVTSASSLTGTSDTDTYPLRLGIMYFEYNSSVAFINHTLVTYSMRGVLGTTNYTVDYTDGSGQKSCESTDITGCDIHHLCPRYGNNTNVVTASNGTFVEIDEAYVICDNPITVTIDHPEFKAIPDGVVDLKLRINETDLYIPNLFCDISMGDPIDKKTTTINQTSTFVDPFNFTFQYIALGRHGISLYCWNLINETWISSMITLTNKDFLFFGSFDRQYSQAENPLPLTLMRDVEIFSRLVVIANSSEKYAVNEWQVTMSVGDDIDRYSLLFPVGQVDAGQYEVILRTYFKEEVDNVIFEPTHVKFISPSPQVHFVGGRIRRLPRGQVTLDAQTLSYDPVNPGTALSFGSWTCYGYNAISFVDAESQSDANTGGTDCTWTSANGNGLKSLDMTASPTATHYVVKVTGTNSNSMTFTNHQIINAVDSTLALNIRCLINCLSKVAVTSYLQLTVDTDHNCASSFSWSLHTKSGSSVSLADKTDTGVFNRTLTIKPGVLLPGTWYIIAVTMTYNGGSHGPAYHEFLTNSPPKGGNCTVYQFNAGSTMHSGTLSTSETYVTMLQRDEFNITCSDWLDEEFTEDTFTLSQPLFYYYYLQYGANHVDRQTLYFDPGSTSNLVTVRLGDPNDGYKAMLVLRIADILGDYSEITFNLTVSPPTGITTDGFLPLQDSAQLVLLSAFTDEFEEEIIKANRTWDYRTLSRKIQDVTSVYNQLILNSTESLSLTPDDLLTLGNQRNENGDILSWNEYWDLIVDVKESEASNHLIQFGERLTASLYNIVVTWPAYKRMPLVSIEVISKGLSATLNRIEYANITAAIQAAHCSEKMAEGLVNHTLDREFPPTEHLMCAMTGVFELNMYILKLLQTVLTPNLPEDPTVDEMRTYLEYIKIFVGVSYDNKSFLSLQEQTFLAQKQLQKYHVQKYLKSEASKTALPDINNSFQNIGKVLKSMASLGRQELIQDNEFTYVSAEKARFFELQNKDIVRPRIVMEVESLSEVTPSQCNASEVTILTTIFKSNPYFWGTFADRITSYVSNIVLDGATLVQPSIIFRLQNYITPPCRDATPTYDEDDENKMIYILLNRRYQDDDILLFIRPNASQLTYEVYLNEGEKPDVEEEKYQFRTNIRTDMWTQEDGYKLLVTSQQFSATGQIWIALRPLLGDSEDELLLKRPFCARIVSVNCVVWKQGDGGEDSWDRHTCEVSERSSRSETVCICKNLADSPSITIGTTFYVPESKVDFQDVEDTSVVRSMQPVYGLIYATIVAYFLLVLWLFREDMRDPYKWSYTLLIDNDIADQYFYVIRVYTGMRTGSGTKSRIAFILAGENSDTGIRILDDPSHLGFERGSVRTFIMGTRRDLGDLISLRIWHDDTGLSEASWYLNQITVTNLSDFQMCGFHCDTWFDYEKGDQRVDRVFTAIPIQEAWSFKEMASYMLAEHHALISIFLRPFPSSFTRIQRLSCLLGMVYLNMFLSTLFLKSKTEEQIATDLSIGPFRFSSENFNVAVTVVAISTVIMAILSFLFRYSRSKNTVISQDQSFFVRQYKRLNAKYSFDRAVLNMKNSPAENAVVYDYNFLPHFVVYISWTLIGLFVGLGLFVMLTTPKSWPEVKSEEWMTTVIVAGVVSCLMIEILKVILILIPYLLLCKRAYEPPRPFMDVETLKEIAKYNSASLTMSPDSNELKAAVSPDEDTLMENKKERINNHQLLKMFSQLALYSGILFIVYTISYAKRDPMSYSLKKNIEDRFTMSKVKDLDTYVDWLNDRFVDQYFSHSFYGTTYTEVDIKPFAEDLVNYRVGPARLRQLRIQPEPCMGPLGLGLTCYTKYKDTNLDTLDYCLGWNDQPCDVSEKSDYFTSPAWEYLSAGEVWGFFTMATYATYGGGGYFMKLDVNKDVCIKIFEELVNFKWFDRKTRVSILEFTLYNANKNLFVYSKFVSEFPEVGGVITFTDVQVFRLYNDTGDDGEQIILLEFLFALLVLAATLKIIYEVATDGCKYFKSVWNLLDVSALLMSYTTIIVYIYKISILELTIATFHEDKNAYVGFENLAFYDYFVNTSHALLVFILSVRVSKILGYSGKINEMAAVVSSSANDLGGFFVIFAIAYFAYVMLGTELFRNETEKYKDMFQTYGTLTEAIVGKNKLANILTNKPGYAEFYYFTFVIFVLMTLATLAAAILNFSISNVRVEQSKMAPTNIVEILADRISWLFNLISRKFSKKSQGGNSKQLNEEDEEANAKEILEDIGRFIRQQIQTSRGNREDMYRVSSPVYESPYGGHNQ